MKLLDYFSNNMRTVLDLVTKGFYKSVVTFNTISLQKPDYFMRWQERFADSDVRLMAGLEYSFSLLIVRLCTIHNVRIHTN